VSTACRRSFTADSTGTLREAAAGDFVSSTHSTPLSYVADTFARIDGLGQRDGPREAAEVALAVRPAVASPRFAPSHRRSRADLLKHADIHILCDAGQFRRPARGSGRPSSERSIAGIQRPGSTDSNHRGHHQRPAEESLRRGGSSRSGNQRGSPCCPAPCRLPRFVRKGIRLIWSSFSSSGGRGSTVHELDARRAATP